MKPAIGIFALLAVSRACLAQPDYGLDFVTVGDPGNAPYVPTDTTWVDHPIGGVDHEYRIMRTEVTVGQWLEFANAYAPYYTGGRGNPEMTGYWLRPDSYDPNVPLSYHAIEGSVNFTADTNWRMAARFCNWLHNGKGADVAAFESGVYDTSTFGKDTNNFFTDQSDPSPGAKYWLPSWDEWVKAAYYDPNKGGIGQSGYWQFPTSSDTAPIQGLPADGGQTNAAGIDLDPQIGFLDVGSYTSVRSPWGLLDTSGSLGEWTGSWGYPPEPFTRKTCGSSLFDAMFDGLWMDYEKIDGRGDAFPTVGGYAIRLATAVPSPGASVFCIGSVWCFLVRRRSRWLLIRAHA